MIYKSWDWVRPPPSLGQNPNFYRKFVLEASLTIYFTFLYPRWTVVFLVYAALVLDNVLLTVVGGIEIDTQANF